MNTQKGITLNFLVWENINTLPLTEDLKVITKEYDWSEFVWNTLGLPIKYAKYSLVDKKLYLQELPDGKTKIQQDNFTGKIRMGGYIINRVHQDGNNYLLGFDVTFCNGEMIEVIMTECLPQPFVDYAKQLEKFNTNKAKIIKRYTSFWYRYLYLPYRIITRLLFYVPITLVWLIYLLLVKILKVITPI